MTFPAFWLFGFLRHMGWPRTTGLFNRKKVVSSAILWGAVTGLVRAGIVLGALRQKTAVSLFADLFSERDWARQPATELWDQLDPSEQVADSPEESPEEVIAGIRSPNSEEVTQGFIEWEFILSELFSTHFHLVFASGLVWGLTHHEEASERYEKQRQRFLKNLPDMLQAGLKVDSPETFEEFADAMQESVDSFQNQVRRLPEIPHALSGLPAIATRLNSI